MKAIRTIKLKITDLHPEFDELATAYQKAANWLSNIVFESKIVKPARKLQKEFYGTVREKFKLPSQVTCALFGHVSGTYKSMKSNGKWSLATYKRPIIPVSWKRDFNVTVKNGMTFWGKPVDYLSREIPKGRWVDSKLVKVKDQWYLCLCVEIDVPETKKEGGIVGVDSGQTNVLTAIDHSTGKTLYIKGGEFSHRRLRIRQTRSKVASVGTRSSYRLLKRLSGREKAVTQQKCHLVSKQVVAFAKSVGAQKIVMENLTGIRKSSERPKDGEKFKQHHKQRARNNRWPFFMTSFFVNYKAIAEGMAFEKVDPKNTSRGCPKCGHTEKSNRNGLVFRCIVCGYADNADRVGAINISLRSLLQRQASEERAVCQSAYSSHDEVASMSYKPSPSGEGN